MNFIQYIIFFSLIFLLSSNVRTRSRIFRSSWSPQLFLVLRWTIFPKKHFQTSKKRSKFKYINFRDLALIITCDINQLASIEIIINLEKLKIKHFFEKKNSMLYYITYINIYHIYIYHLGIIQLSKRRIGLDIFAIF